LYPETRSATVPPYSAKFREVRFPASQPQKLTSEDQQGVRCVIHNGPGINLISTIDIV